MCHTHRQFLPTESPRAGPEPPATSSPQSQVRDLPEQVQVSPPLHLRALQAQGLTSQGYVVWPLLDLRVGLEPDSGAGYEIGNKPNVESQQAGLGHSPCFPPERRLREHGCDPTGECSARLDGRPHCTPVFQSSTRQSRPSVLLFPVSFHRALGAGSPPAEPHRARRAAHAPPEEAGRPSSVGAVGSEGWHHSLS